MARVTALHPERRDRVRVELDGAPWRTLPAAAVVSARLTVGMDLDRIRARELRRRSVAPKRSAQQRGRSRAATGRGRARRRISRAAASVASRSAPRQSSRLADIGYLDDARFALAARAIARRPRLRRRRDPLRPRARGCGRPIGSTRRSRDSQRSGSARSRLADRDGATPRTARRLARARAFRRDTIEAAAAMRASSW